MGVFYRAIKPLLFQLPPEQAHHLGIEALRLLQATPLAGVCRRHYLIEDERLSIDRFGCHFPNPVGVAAGLDKNARVPRGLAALGFGHVEVGGVTAHGQAGNPRPRLFRLPEDRALINRMGFNNDGADVIGQRLRSQRPPPVPLGVNLGKSKDTPLAEAAEDYRYTYDQVAQTADFVVLNVSSPNTPGLRELQAEGPLGDILEHLQGETPVLLKLSPDLALEAIETIIDVAETMDVAGIIATNTTTERPGSLKHPNREETGGLSGAPLAARSSTLIGDIADRTALPIVGVGGIFTAADAYEKIKQGASIVQLYTGMVYRGPSIAKEINQGLLELLEADGFDSIEEAVGSAR